MTSPPNALQIKTGSLSRSDRIAKYNQLLRIEEDLVTLPTTPAAKPSTTCVDVLQGMRRCASAATGC